MQIISLAWHLARFASAEAALADAPGRRPPLIQPEPYDENGTRVLTYPGDPRRQRARARPACPSACAATTSASCPNRFEAFFAF